MVWWRCGSVSFGLLLALLTWTAAASLADQTQDRAESAQQLVAAAPASKCHPQCTLHGTCNEELGRCDCPKHLVGPSCSDPADPSTLELRCKQALYPDVKECQTYPQACMNACNKRGECIAGFCHCRPGHFGADCSLSLGPDGRPLLLAGTRYSTRSKRPHVYVYELPPHLTSWVNARRLDRPTHNLLAQRLLSSGARTADGDSADWYYIPVRCRGHGDGHLLREAILHVRSTWPWWNVTQGARHVLVHTGDLGVEDSPSELRLMTRNSTWLTHWGLHGDRKECCGWRAAHRPGQDVVIPVFISTGSFKKFGFTNSPLHPGHRRQPTRDQAFFFAGRICGDRREPDKTAWPNCQEGHDYSANARQKVHYYHHNRSGYTVVTHSKHYERHLRATRFCLAPLGGGHGQRQIIVALMGCIPVTIGDHVHQPFEPELDWSKFSVSVREADIPTLHVQLQEVEAQPGALASLQRALSCAAQHMVYSSITGGILGDQGKYDAFETTLEVLRVMRKYPGLTPSEFSNLDPEFRRFMNCGADGSLGSTSPAVQGAAVQDAEAGSSDGGPDDEEEEEPDAAPAGLRSPGPVPAAASYRTSLCSNSWLDKPRKGQAAAAAAAAARPGCYECLVGASNTLGFPGGAICCGSDDDLSGCLRTWE